MSMQKIRTEQPVALPTAEGELSSQRCAAFPEQSRDFRAGRLHRDSKLYGNLVLWHHHAYTHVSSPNCPPLSNVGLVYWPRSLPWQYFWGMRCPSQSKPMAKQPSSWSLIGILLFSRRKESHLIFRYAAAPNTTNTTAMTVTVMAAILPVRKRPRKDNERVSLVIFRVPNI